MRINVYYFGIICGDIRSHRASPYVRCVNTTRERGCAAPLFPPLLISVTDSQGLLSNPGENAFPPLLKEFHHVSMHGKSSHRHSESVPWAGV